MSTITSPVSDLKPRQKRPSLQLNRLSFTRSTEERPDANAGEIARVRKAAAWQWYTRGAADHVVVPTKRAPSAGAAASTAENCSNNRLNSMPRATSRFKAEASARNRPSQSTAPSPLYDEFELSGVKSHMAELVQRLQQKQEEGGASAAAHQISHKPPSGAAFPTSGFRRPLSAIHKFFRKISGGYTLKSSTSTKSLPISANHGPTNPADDEMNHYHHYIHHHHHHYHYGCSPEESFDFQQYTLREQLWEAPAVHKEDPLKQTSPHRRRHSESFSTHEEVIGRPLMASELTGRGPNSARFSTHLKNQGRQKVEQLGVDIDDDQISTIPRIRRHSAESFRSSTLDCSTPYSEAAYDYELPLSPRPHDEAAAYKVPLSLPTTARRGRRHSETYDSASHRSAAH